MSNSVENVSVTTEQFCVNDPSVLIYCFSEEIATMLTTQCVDVEAVIVDDSHARQ